MVRKYIENITVDKLNSSVDISKAEGIEIISTNKDVDFINAIVQNAQDTASISGQMTSNKYMIRGVNIQSIQPLHYQLILYSSMAMNNANLNLDTFLDSVDLDMSSLPTFRINNAGQYYLNISNLEIIYDCTDNTQTMHIGLQNLDPNAKLALAAGSVQIDIKMTPRL